MNQAHNKRVCSSNSTNTNDIKIKSKE